MYKKVQGLDKMLAKGSVPSLKQCTKLVVKGKVALENDIVFKVSVYTSLTTLPSTMTTKCSRRY